MLQFITYGLCGCVAFLSHITLVTLLGHTLFPAFDSDLGDALRFKHSALNNTLAFLLSNTVAYLLNIRFVFTSGRYSRKKEIILFFLAAALSFFPALFSLKIIITQLGLHTHLANLSFVITSALFNFAIRKFLIFQK